VLYQQFAPHDRSQAFADELVALALAPARPARSGGADRCRAAAPARAPAWAAMQRYGIADVNLVKPGIGEATRVLLRRVPRLLVLRDPLAADVAHLRCWPTKNEGAGRDRPRLPYHAVSLIRSASDG
jgi:hypothetical protein